MGETVKVAAKKPEAKIGNKASKTQRTVSSQSFSSPVEQILVLQRTVGNQSVQRLIRSGTLQKKLKIGLPGDVYEQEADRMAEKVVRMPDQQSSKEAMISGRSRNTLIQTKEASSSTPEVTTEFESRINLGGGQPLPESVRAFYEPRFGADFSQVRVHTGSQATQTANSIQAKAFTVGRNITFGGGQFAPQSKEGQRLIAHELTHTIQQGYSVQRSPQISKTTTPIVQRLPDFLVNKALNFISRNAEAIPGFTMLTVVMGKNPLTGATVDRSPGNILKGAIEIMPGGSFVTQALNNHGIFDKVSVWTLQQFNTLKEIGANIWQNIKDFVNKFDISDITDLGGVWQRAKNIVTAPIDRIISFAAGLKNDIVTFVKDAILKPIAEYAKENTSGYPLLCAVMGRDPISGEVVPQDANALLGGFMIFIGEEETWTNMQKAGAVPRAFAWFKNAVQKVKGFVSEIPGLFIAAFKALDITDIILIPRAFIKLARVFGGFAGRFINWGLNTVWNLLEIIFDSLKPGIMGYIKRTGAALKSILKNPIPFVGNLVKAAITGFKNFANRIGEHLKAGLIDWLTGSLTGVYIPKALSLIELGKFALSVLGITWAQIRGKIVKALGPTGEKIMNALETGFDIVVALIKGGPAVAWEFIKEKLTDLKDMVISGIIGFVTETVAKKAVPKLVAMFIPGAGFISAIISIYDTIMVFVQKISKIIQVVTAFIDSIVTIAAGNITAAASRVESILAGLISLAISFLAGFVGLGKVTDKIMEVINKVRGVVDKALDWVINKVVGKAKEWFAKVFGKKGKDGETQKSKALKQKVGRELAGKEITNAEQGERLISSVYLKYSAEGLKGIRLIYNPKKPKEVAIRVSASVPEIVANLPLTSIEKAKTLADFAFKFWFRSEPTLLYVYYDSDNKEYKHSPIRNEGVQDAEAVFKSRHMSKLRKEIEESRKNRTLKTPSGQRIKVELNLNRLPCPNCSAIIADLSEANRDIVFVVKASSRSKNSGTVEVHAAEILKMIKADVIVEPLGIWPVIQRKFIELAFKMKAHKITFKETDEDYIEIKAAATLIPEMLSREQDVKAVIERAKELFEKEKAGSKKNIDDVPPKGSGA